MKTVTLNNDLQMPILDFELAAYDAAAIAALDQKASSFFDHRDLEKVKWLGQRKLPR